MIKFYYKLSLLLSAAYCLTPWWLNTFLGRMLAFVWVDIFQIRKDVVYSNIDLAFPNTPVDIKKKWMQQSLYVLCRSFFDVIRIPGLKTAWIRQNVNFIGLENLKPYSDVGVIFLSLHMASGDLAGALFSQEVRPLSLITKRIKNKFFDTFWFALRTQSKTEFIDAHGKNNAFEILKALKNKRGVVFVVDQFMGKPYGIETDFFGHKTGTAYGLALFAQKTKAPVLPLSTFWGVDGKLNIQVGPVLDFNLGVTDDKAAQNLSMTNQVNRVVEQIIRQHPDQWMWVHKRWKVFE
jgi:KDO2-lipid IV(A) lauroyltransferase